MVSYHSKRKGFTLIELLVVIGIIVVLAALTVGAALRLMGSQQESTTQTTMQHVDRALQQAWAKVVSDAKKEDISSATNVSNNLAAGDPRRAQVIWIKLRLMEAFPVTYAECNVVTNPLYVNSASFPGGLIPSGMRKNIATYQRKLGNAAVHPSFPNSESSACLLMALSINRGGNTLNADLLGSNIVDTDGDGVKEIIDGWRTPVFFYRFPTPTQTVAQQPAWAPVVQQTNPALSNYTLSGSTFIAPGASAARNALFADPVDPDGTLMDPTWFASPQRQAFETLCHPIVSPVSITAGNNVQYPAFYVTPAIVSAGANGKYTAAAGINSSTTIIGLGLTPPFLTAANQQVSPQSAPTYATPTAMNYDITNYNGNSQLPSDATDNICNFLLRAGGTGN